MFAISSIFSIINIGLTYVFCTIYTMIAAMIFTRTLTRCCVLQIFKTLQSLPNTLRPFEHNRCNSATAKAGCREGNSG
jgi:hypothetical protein